LKTTNVTLYLAGENFSMALITSKHHHFIVDSLSFSLYLRGKLCERERERQHRVSKRLMTIFFMSYRFFYYHFFKDFYHNNKKKIKRKKEEEKKKGNATLLRAWPPWLLDNTLCIMLYIKI